MFYVRKHIEHYGACTIFIMLTQISCSFSGGSNLNMHEGVTTPYIIGGDVFFEIVKPAELHYTYRVRPAQNFGGNFNESFCLKNTKLVVMDPIDGCSPPENADLLEGNVGLVVRGECSFLHKTIVAEEAGARALIITEYEENSLDPAADLFIEMIDDKSDRDASIPAAFLLGRNGAQIQSTLDSLHLSYAIINIPVNMTYMSINKMNQPPWISW